MGGSNKWIRSLLMSLLGTFGPTLIVIILIYCGIGSAFSFFTGASKIETIDVETCTLKELIDAVKDKDVFTDEMVEDTMLDRTSLKRLLEAVYKYNNEQLSKTLTIQHTKKWKVETSTWVPTPYINEYGLPDIKWTKKTSIKSKSANEGVKILMDNTWTRKKYPIDWQVVYLLCVFHSIDFDEDTELDETGTTVRLKKSFIEQVIEDVASEYNWEANAVEYDWGWFTIKPEEVRNDYGRGIYYKEHNYFVPDSSVYSNGYSYSGYVPVNYLKTVQSLTSIDSYPTGGLAPRNCSTTYDCSKLVELMETYGQGRTIGAFLAALKELPQGERIADKLIYDLKQGGHKYE